MKGHNMVKSKNSPIEVITSMPASARAAKKALRNSRRLSGKLPLATIKKIRADLGEQT